MRTRTIPAAALLAALVLAPALRAQDLRDFEKRLTVHKLDNGLTFLILERPEAPVVSFFTHVNVGSVREAPGITGLAHMFEHMAFKGTPRVGTSDYEAEKAALVRVDEAYAALRAEQTKTGGGDPDEIARLEEAFKKAQEDAARYIVPEEFTKAFDEEGGVGLNAFTNADTTGYMVSLPANKMELWAYMESERFLHPVFREFYKERSVVQEERRLRTESQPIGRLLEEVQTTAFKAHPYGHPVVGYMSDLQAFTRQDAREFYRKYYIPSNMVIAIVGDVKAREIIPTLDEYFSRLPAGVPPGPLRTVEPPQIAERAVVIREKSQPIYMAAYHRPPTEDPDGPALDTLSDILGSGRTSRLYKRLVKEENLASFVGIFSGYPGDKYPTLLLVYAVPSKGHTAAEVGRVVDEEIERIQEAPPSAEELKRVKTEARANFIRSLDSNMGMAMELADWQTRTGDWRDLFHHLDQVQAVSAEDVQRVARDYLRKGNRTVGEIVTQDETPAAGGEEVK